MAFLLVESNCICLFKRHGHLLSFYYHCLCRLSGGSAPLFFFFVPFLLILKACNLASDWSLVVDPCIFSLVTCMVACVCFIVYAILCIVFSIRKGCNPASDWSLVIEFHVVLLVTCRVACCTVLLHILSAFAGDCASDWSLAIDYNTNVLVACVVA